MSRVQRISRASVCFLVLLHTAAIVADPPKADNTAELRKIIDRKEQRVSQPELELQGRDKIAYEAIGVVDVNELDLPQDTSTRFPVKEIKISGNTLITTDQLLSGMPVVFNTSDQPLHKAPSGALFDFRVLRDVAAQPGPERLVSERTMQGFTQYILSVYQANGYAGIYVYIAAQAVRGAAELQDGILPIQIVEAKIAEVTVTYYDNERQRTEKGILRRSAIEKWSPVQPGRVADRKKLDYFVNLLNLNPDRYVSAVVSKGAEPETLALGYEIYETNPWHYFAQVDDSGTEERQWAPTFGVINTNLTGRDDKFTVMYQVPLESNDDNYSLFAGYDIPLWTPRLRASVFAGKNEFDVGGGGGIDFIGKGHFFGGQLTYNLLQRNRWFLDVKTALTRESSEVTPSLFQFLNTDINMDIWTVGVNLHRSHEGVTSYLGFDRAQCIGGSSKAAFEKARAGTDPDFSIYILSAAHSRQLGPQKAHRLSGSFRLIIPDDRLAPSKMTTFGGLYSVRGYKEDEVVADGGILFSLQHEFDLIKHGQLAQSTKEEEKRACLQKLALISFFDFARAKTKDSVEGEMGVQELCSLGFGTAMEFGKNVQAAVYYGIPLRATRETKSGRGRFNFSFTVRN